MISERVRELQPAPAPGRDEVMKCLRGCIAYRIRMANSVSGTPEPSLREKMATEIVSLWDEVERLRDIQGELIEEIEHLQGLKKRGSNG